MESRDAELPAWVTPDVDLERPSIARIYDYLLGGYHNFEPDRIVAQRAMEIYPDLALSAKVNRAFLRRAVAYMLEQGITQFMDIGSGIPTVRHIHEIAQQANPASRVVYVDIDPIAITHSRAIIGDDPLTIAFQADAEDPDLIFDRIQDLGILDLDKPVGLLMLALIHFVTGTEDARELIGRYTSRLAPGSYLAFTHGTTENTPPGAAEGIMKLANSSTQHTTYRRQAEIFHIFDTLDFVEPGIVFLPLWRPETPEDPMLDDPNRSMSYGGVAKIAD